VITSSSDIHRRKELVQWIIPYLESWPNEIRSIPEYVREVYLEGHGTVMDELFTVMDASGLSVDDKCLSQIMQSTVFPYLRWLDLSHNLITAYGVREMCRQKLTSELEGLVLFDNEISNEGLLEVVTAKAMRQLKVLDVGANNIDCEGLAVFGEEECDGTR